MFDIITMGDQKYISASDFSEHKNIREEKVISMIKEGFYQGRISNDKWYVLRSELDSSVIDYSSVIDQTDTPQIVNKNTHNIYDMPFLSLVGFMFKLSFAAIPAFVVASIVWNIIVAIFDAVLYSGNA